jgi:hypothetical protein
VLTQHINIKLRVYNITTAEVTIVNNAIIGKLPTSAHGTQQICHLISVLRSQTA